MNTANGPRSRRLLLINANTDPAITDRLVAAAQQIAPTNLEIVGATARFGARYVATRAAYTIAGHAALDAYAEHSADADAVLLACFGDPGLAGLRELAPVPVIGMADAACRRAAERFQRFSIVTGGANWPSMLREFLAGLGLAQKIASIRAVDATGGQIVQDPSREHETLVRECIAAMREDGAEAAILGGAGLVGIAEAIARDVPIPVLDGFLEAMYAAQEAMHEPHEGGRDAPHSLQVETSGLGACLASLMSGRRRPSFG